MIHNRSFLALAAILAGAPAASANVVTDWDEIAVKTIQAPGPVPPVPGDLVFRASAMVNVAMFDAVNCIEPRYRSYKMQVEPSPDTSRDAAAASVAANVLMQLVPNSNVNTTLTEYLARIPDGPAKDRGIKLGEEVAATIVKLRADDGATARNAYRPVTEPGRYVPTALTVGWQATEMKPFVLNNGAQFRPGPPPELTSATWAKDYNEVKNLGDKNSTMRTPQQTETARLWLAAGPIGYHPWERQIVIAKKMSVVDSARFMALLSVAEADAIQSVYAAKWLYMFWRPMTAIRNGDIDNNPATERDATWEPIDNTPLHPEYPCAHCILSGAVTTVIEKVLGTADIPEVAVSTPTAPGVTHRFTNLNAIADEVSMARIYAGFHYRNSTVVGREMGNKIGDYVVANVMQPL
jgi:PAP2 superfamily